MQHDHSLQAIHLQKTYQKREVVRHVSLQVSSGEIVGLLGPNGAGKTTSFYMILGLVNCDHGQILLDQQDITRLTLPQRARLGIGYLPQQASIFRKMTVKDNLLSILQLQKLSSKQQHQRLEELLVEFNLTHLSHHFGFQLSGGEQRRTEIARALAVHHLHFILLDEPFAGVDPISIAEIKASILHLKQRGLGILVTDHHVRAILDTCQRAYIIHQGRVMTEGTPQSILQNEQVRTVYLGEESHF